MPRSTSAGSVAAQLDRHLERESRRRARNGLPAPQVLVSAPELEYRSGDQDAPFHAASVGKLATAALVRQEIERGRIDVSTPVAEVLDPAELDGLFAAEGVTIGQLLGHTSGIADYFEGRVTSGERFRRRLEAEPDREWTPAELLAFTREHQRPIAAPGRRFHYSDTGYVLLGRVVETLDRRDFAAALRARVLEPAGMRDSVLWRREPGPERIQPALLGDLDLGARAAATCDWAGGGIVTTLDDLRRLLIALVDGTVIDPASFAAMTDARSRLRPGIRYGQGAMALDFGGFLPLLRGLPATVGHLGALGVHAFIDVEHEAIYVANHHSTREMGASFRTHIRAMQALQRLRG